MAYVKSGGGLHQNSREEPGRTGISPAYGVRLGSQSFSGVHASSRRKGGESRSELISKVGKRKKKKNGVTKPGGKEAEKTHSMSYTDIGSKTGQRWFACQHSWWGGG